jgi:putative transposase
MSTPRHRSTPGASYFVTTKCFQARATFQVTDVAKIMVETILHYRQKSAYLLHAFVVMPDHLHLLITPGATTSLEKAVQFIKGGSSYSIHNHRGHNMEIWQVGFYDWTIRDMADWQAKIDYIHQNPVRGRLVDKPEDWPYSSAAGRFQLDSIPAKYANLASGAKAPNTNPDRAQGLKPLPPAEAQESSDDDSETQPRARAHSRGGL